MNNTWKSVTTSEKAKKAGLHEVVYKDSLITIYKNGTDEFVVKHIPEELSPEEIRDMIVENRGHLLPPRWLYIYHKWGGIIEVRFERAPEDRIHKHSVREDFDRGKKLDGVFMSTNYDFE